MITAVPSKSQCLKTLRRAFGPRVRFARFGADGLAVVNHSSTGEEFHVAEVEPRTPEAAAQVHWYALVASFQAHGYRVVLREGQLYAVPFERLPGESIADAVKRDRERERAERLGEA